MPKTEYTWNETNVDIFSNDSNDDKICEIKLITDFFKNINVGNLGNGIVTKLYENDYNTIKSILHIKKKNLLEIEGFQETLANKIVSNIKTALEKVDIIQLMNASNIFGTGLGKKKLNLLFVNIPDLMTRKANEDLVEDIIEIEGFSTITAERFVHNFDTFKKFLKELNIKSYNISTYVKNNKNVVFTGFRNNDLEKKLLEVNISVNNTINSDTFLVVKKDKNTNSSKIQEALKKNIEVITLDTFIKKYKK